MEAIPKIKQAISLESPYKFKFHDPPCQKDHELFNENIKAFKKTLESQKSQFAKDKKTPFNKVFKKKELGLINETILYKNIVINDQNSIMARLNTCVIPNFLIIH